MRRLRHVLQFDRLFFLRQEGQEELDRNEVRGEVRKVRRLAWKQAYLADGAVGIAAGKTGGMVNQLMEYISDEHLGCKQQHDKS